MKKMHEQGKDGLRQMKIGQLIIESGVKKSAIHHYLRMGLLPEAKRGGLSVHLYSDVHLVMLKEIRRLREQEKLPLSRIKKILKERDWHAEALRLKSELNHISEIAIAGHKPIGKTKTNEKREQILAAATQLFSQKGFENFRIEDLAESLQMSRTTFYVYFQNKEELLSECINQLGKRIIPIAELDEVLRETDFFKRNRKRTEVFLRNFPEFKGILTLARTLSGQRDSPLGAKAVEAFRLVALPVKKDLEQGMEKGSLRKLDAELVAYMAFGMAEALAYRLSLDSEYTEEQGVEECWKLFKYGIWNPAASGLSPKDTEPV